LSEIGKVEEFFDAIDDDDFERAKSLMKRAGIDAKDIAIVLKKISDADDDH
jgi:predicted AAA+ superfamily ATPase